MDNIGDWLYIVFIIIAGISGIFGSGKKKRRPTEILGQPEEVSTQPEESFPGKKFWEIFEKPGQPEPQPVRPLKKESHSKIKQTNKSFLEGEKTLMPPVSPQQSIPETEIQEQEQTSLYNFQDADDLKKAVIYSEIINRKY